MVKLLKDEKEEVKMDVLLEQAKEKLEIEDMPLTSLRDYRLYNEAARKANKKAKKCIYSIKPCPTELHPHQRIVFNRKDQPTNALAVYKSDDVIDFKMTLIPGKTYDLPEYIIHYLSEKANPIWGWVDLPNGERETRVVNKDHRFQLRQLYQEA